MYDDADGDEHREQRGAGTAALDHRARGSTRGAREPRRAAGCRVRPRAKRSLVSELCFALQQLFDRDADLGGAAEHGALLALLHALQRGLGTPSSGSGTYFTSFASSAPFFR